MSDKTARNDVTGDLLRSKPSNDMFEENFDLIFRKKKPIPHEEMVKKMLKNPEVLAEYELHKSTGEVIRKETKE